MKGCNRFARNFAPAAAIIVGLMATSGSVTAQRPEAAPRITVLTFRSADKQVGRKAAESVRDELARNSDPKKLYILPQADVKNTLEASGYSITDALAPNDAKALAGLLRADTYVDGTVAKTPAGYRVDARLVVARDNSLAQPLPPVEVSNVAQAGKPIANAVRDALRQVDAEKACYAATRAGNLSAAVKAARAGIAAYPRSTIARTCLANLYYAQMAKATNSRDSLVFADSVLAVARDIRTQDPRNVSALRFSAELYKLKNDSTRYYEALTSLLTADPTDLKLQSQVINDLAANGKAALAVPILKQSLQANPGEPRLLRTAFLVYLAASDFQNAVAVGPELIRVDTAAADSSYYVRMAAAYQSLNQPAQAAQAIAQGTAKYPRNASLQVLYGQTLKKAGQGPQAIEAFKRALALDPKLSTAYLQVADIYSQAGQTDSVAAVLQRAASAPGVDRAILAQYALGQGNTAYKAGVASKNRADYQRAISLLQLSDRIQPSSDAKFLIGASSFSIGQSAATEAGESKNCSLARLAQESFATAATNLRAGSDKYAEPARQLLGYIPQFTPAVESQIKRFCR